MNQKKIPKTTIPRLFVYLRELTILSEFNIRTISSAELGERVNFSDAQVRKDLGYFGQFGTSGSGYQVNELKQALKKILGKNKTWNVAIIGVGNLGGALLSYSGFKPQGLSVVAAFDSSVNKIGKKQAGIMIQALDELGATVKEKDIAIGIITIPATEAQKVADMLVAAKVECIMNFAPVVLNVPENVNVKDVDLSKELETLSYYLANGNGETRT